MTVNEKNNPEQPALLSKLTSSPLNLRVFNKNEAESIITRLFKKANIEVNGPNPCDIQIHNPLTYKRILGDGSLGLGESYQEGWWDVDDIDEFFVRVLNARLESEIKTLFMMGQILKAKAFNLQDKIRSQKVAQMHYDLGNDFYEKMLDPHMQYTCAYYKDTQDLNQAQEAKLDLVCRKLNLQSGDKVLELGCGWGGFARFAVKNYGVKVVAYNISKEQVAYAREKSMDMPIEYRLEDYRDATGLYDKIVSIGLAEHVGHKNFHGFFDLAHKCLKPEGLFLMHTIGNNKTKLQTEPWLDKYIFPGSLLPSAQQLSLAYEGKFIMEDWHNFGADYDKTLVAWFHNFNRNWQAESKEEDHFYRTWKYYLLGCAASFRIRKNQLWQIVFSKKGVPHGYISQR